MDIDTDMHMDMGLLTVQAFFPSSQDRKTISETQLG